MKVKDLAENIFQGWHHGPTELTISPNSYIYLLPENLRNNLISEENAKYVTDKIAKKYTKSQLIEYGDIVIYHKDDNDFGVFRFTQDISKNIIPSVQFAIIKSPNSFLTNVLQHESGRSYFRSELVDLWKHKEGILRNLIKELKEMDIPLVFENAEISIAPGNIPIEKTDFARINIKKGIMSTDNLIKRVDLKEVKIDGYFQRKSKLWDPGTKSRLIETILLDIPIPPLYFDIVSKSEWLVIDGLQRITTIFDFVKNRFELSELDFMPELNGSTFESLDRDRQRSIEEYELTNFSIQPGTPRSVRYKIFKNINTSALVLTRQEIRHAMNEDETVSGFTPSRYLKTLTDILNNYLSIPEAEIERMYDRELALRYVTFRMFFYKTDYKPSMADFLDKAMENLHSYPRNKLELYRQEFSIILTTLLNIFNKDNIFTRKMITSLDDEVESRKIINGALLEVWLYGVSQLSDQDKQLLVTKKNLVKKKTQELKGDDSFMKSIDPRYSNNIDMVKIRFATITNLLRDTLNEA